MNHPGAILTVDDDVLCRVIERATTRLVVVTPGMSLSVAEILADKWRLMGADNVHVTVDVDAEVFRLGMGEFEAVKLLETTAHALGTTLNIQPGLRIAVIVSDSDTLIYSPTIECVQAMQARPGEPNSDRPLQPNAIHLSQPPAQLANDLGIGPDGVRTQTIGLDKAPRGTIKEVEQQLKQCPPQPFDLTRRLRVYAAHIEFVELRLTGCNIGRRTIAIPPDLVGLTDEKTRRLLESKFRILAEGDTGVWGQELRAIKDFIVRRFLVLLPGFGYVLRVEDKRRFELAVKTLRKLVARARLRKRKKLQAAIDRHRDALVNALLPAVTCNPPKRWSDLFPGNPDDLLRDELKALIGNADDLLSEAKVELRYKGVTYETLQDPQFVASVQRALPDLEALHSEWTAAMPGKGR